MNKPRRKPGLTSRLRKSEVTTLHKAAGFLMRSALGLEETHQVYRTKKIRPYSVKLEIERRRKLAYALLMMAKRLT